MREALWACGLVAAGLAIGLRPFSPPSLLDGGLLLLLLLFELRSPGLGRLGSFRLGAPVLLVCLLHGLVAPALATVLAAAGLRGALVSERSGSERWLEEGLAFLQASLTALMASLALPVLEIPAATALVAGAYLAVTLFLPEAVGATAPPLLAPLAQAGLAVVGLVLLQSHPLLALGLIPFPGLLGSIAQAEETSQIASRVREVAGVAREQRRELRQTRRELQTTADALEVTRQEFLVLAGLARTLALAPNLEATLAQIVASARELSGAEQVVLFRPEEGWLVPAAGAEAGEVRLLRLTEPVVTAAWERRQPVFSEGDGRGIFPGDLVKAAYPVGDLAVLYLGGAAFERRDHLLRLVADQAAIGIQAALRLESQREALRQLETAHGQAVDKLELLSALYEHSAQIAIAPEPEAEFRRAAAEFVPFEQCLVWRQGEPWPEGGLGEMLRAAEEHRRPLLYEDTSEGRFAPGPAWKSLLAVPFEGGWTVVGSPEAGRFQPVHQEILGNLTVALAGARLREQLLHSSKLAAVGQLAAGVAHELNSPLGSIKLNLDLARRRPEKAEELLEQADRSVARAQSIVNGLLHYSREAPSRPVTVRLDEVARETLELLSHQLSGVEVERELEPASAQGNPAEIHQILANLLLNARDAVAGGAASRVVIRTREGLVEVEDNGPGIPTEIQSRVFEPFFTTKEVGRGTGLGLSVSARLAERQGGSLTFESRPGRTVFRFRTDSSG